VIELWQVRSSSKGHKSVWEKTKIGLGRVQVADRRNVY
jgi:hypothetical protein